MKNTIQQNLVIILGKLYELPKELIPATKLQEEIQLTPEELNDACTILESCGYVELLRYSSTHPYEFGNIQITSAGKFEYERASLEAELKQKKESIYDSEEQFDSSFVSQKRIDQLSSIKNQEFDLSKLIILLTELNISAKNVNVYSVAMLLRAIIDHIPPIFNKNSFTEIINNYSWTKSNRELMERLDLSFRKIADSYLHTKIRKKESIPTLKQVDFRAELDVLLGEIILLLE